MDKKISPGIQTFNGEVMRTTRHDERAPFSEYRRLIFQMLEDLKYNHQKLEEKHDEELREMREKLAECSRVMSEVQRENKERTFKLNWWHTVLAALPGLIALLVSLYKTFKS